MTLALSYNSTLGRTQIALSNRADGTVLVERSFNQLLWQTVRGGVALPVVSGAATLNDDELADGIANHYRVTPVNPAAGLLLDGAVGSYASTPDTAVLDIVGDVDLRFDGTTDWTSPGGVARVLVAKYNTTGNQRAYRLNLIPGGLLQMQWSTNGASPAVTVPATIPVPAINGRQAVRATVDVNNGASGNTVRFYIAPTMDGPFTLLQEITNSGTTSIFSSSAALTVGASNDGASDRFTGTIHHAQVRNSSDTVVANPRFNVQDHADTSFVDGVGLAWTVNGTAVIMGVETDSITPVDGRIWLKSIRHPFLNRPVTVTDFQDPARAARGSLGEVSGRSLPVGTSDVRASQAFTVELQTTTPVEARDMDLILASGDFFYLQVPPNCPVPGGYVQIGDTSQARRTRSARSARRYITLPCRVAAPPGPDVVGTTMTWGTVFNQYGSWQALLAANPTWGDLLATVGSPDDLVVL